MARMSEKRRAVLAQKDARGLEYKRFMYDRFFTCGFLAFLQILISVIFLYVWDHESEWFIQLIIRLIAYAFVLYLINRPENPSAKLMWIVMILLFPIIGSCLFLLYGEGRPTSRMRKKYYSSKSANEKFFIWDTETKKKAEQSGRNAGVCNYLMKNAGYPVYDDGTIDYYPMGAELFEAMIQEVPKAEKFILIEYFILSCGKLWDRLRAALLERADAGVQVYIIYDDFGSILHLPHDYGEYVETLHPNFHCLQFNKVIPLFAIRQNCRDHRKMFVVDDKVAFTGGLNLADEYIGEKIRFGTWKDSGVRVTGKAVTSFIVMFFDLWNAFNKKQIKDVAEFIDKDKYNRSTLQDNKNYFVQPFDDSPLDSKSDAEFVYLDVINRATKYVYIFTPYLIVPDSLRMALCHASQRGVDVRIVTPSIPDKKLVFRMTRANYGPLMKAGVKIYEYTPGFMHSKSIVADDECAVVGSINFDYRSLYLHFENAVYFSGCDAVVKVREDAEKTFEESSIRTPENTKRTWFGRIFDGFLRFMETVV